MKAKLLFVSIVFTIFSCSTTKNVSTNPKQSVSNDAPFSITEISENSSYGLTADNPVQVGSEGSGPRNERKYLNALCGPNGETISYYRAGSCCPTESEKVMFGDKVILDNYRVTWQGSKDIVSIYINMYDLG